MLPVETLRTFFAAMAEIVVSLVRFVRGHALLAVGSVVIALFLTNAWTVYDIWRTRDIEFLTGPLGGSGSDLARQVADHAAKPSTPLSARFRVRIQHSNGYEENRRRINQDHIGHTVGYAHDGFGESENLSILVPLEWNCLQIVVAKSFLSHINRLSEPLTLGQLVSHLQNGRVYLGPPESGTRQLADIVLKRHRPDYSELLCAHGIADWNEMRAALAADAIDLAFYSGPPNARIVEDIARDGKCRLVGLNGTRDAVVQGHPQLAPVNLAAGLYRDSDFCPQELHSIASRRVLACSKAMSQRDAYLLTKLVSEAVGNQMAFQWDMQPPGREQTRFKTFAYSIHPGARLVRDKKTLFPWLPSLSTAFLALGLFAVGEVGRVLRSRRTPAAGDNAVAKPEDLYGALVGEVNQTIHDVERLPIPMDVTVFNEYFQRLGDFRRRINDGDASGAITRDQARSLMAGVRELHVELDVHRPPKERIATKTKKAGGHPKGH